MTASPIRLMSAPCWQPLGAVLGLALLVLAAPAAAAKDPLAKCRQAHDDFEFEQVVKRCERALKKDEGKNELTKEQKVDAMRLLGIAEVSLNHEKNAEAWFLKLLLLDPAFTLDRSLGPVYREAFGRARASLEKQGQVSASLELKIDGDTRGPWPAVATVEDPLGRVASGTLLVRAVRNEDEFGRRTIQMTREGNKLSGEVTDPTPVELEGDYTLEVQLTVNDAAGQPITPKAPVPAQKFPRAGAAPEGEGGSAGLWIGIGGGAAAAAGVAVVVVGGGAAVAVGCLLTGACTGGNAEPSSHVHVEPAL